MSDYSYNINLISSSPRNKRITGAVNKENQSSVGFSTYDFCYWKYVTTAMDADGKLTSLSESEYYLESEHPIKVDGNISTTGNVMAAGDVQAGDKIVKNLVAPLAGYEAIGMAKFGEQYFDISADGLVTLKDSVLSQLEVITTSSSSAETDGNVYSALKVKNLLNGITGKPTALWLDDGTTKYLYYTSSTVNNATVIIAYVDASLHVSKDLDVSGKADVTGNISSAATIAAAGDVQAGDKVIKDLVAPLAGYDSIGMAKFNSDDFSVDSTGKISLKGQTITGAYIVAQPTQPTAPSEGTIWIETDS